MSTIPEDLGVEMRKQPQDILDLVNEVMDDYLGKCLDLSTEQLMVRVLLLDRSRRTGPDTGGEVVAWAYQTATSVDAIGNYANWQWRTSLRRPDDAPSGTTRNVQPLRDSSEPVSIPTGREGFVNVPIEPSDGLLNSMALRFDHGIFAPAFPGAKFIPSTEEERQQRIEVTRTIMRQLHEEVVGKGFYRPEREAEYAAKSAPRLAQPSPTTPKETPDE